MQEKGNCLQEKKVVCKELITKRIRQKLSLKDRAKQQSDKLSYMHSINK